MVAILAVVYGYQSNKAATDGTMNNPDLCDSVKAQGKVSADVGTSFRQGINNTTRSTQR